MTKIEDLPAIDKPGYHLHQIPKGEVGELSKVLEEVLEAQDAELQDSRIMTLMECSDILAALKRYLEKHHPGFSLSDLRTMAEITGRAFTNGHRSG